MLIISILFYTMFTEDVLKRKWADMMCSEATRSDARYIIDNVLIHPFKAIPTIAHLIRVALQECL